jgi:hypothetical protein
LLYLDLNHLSPIFLATPKRQRGRKAQQARAAACVAATPSAAVAAGATATVTNTTVTTATTTTTTTAAPSMPNVAAADAAVAATIANLIDEENPFIESTQSSQLEDHMHTLVIRSSRSSSVGKDSTTSKSSEVGVPNQKNRKEAQDVNEFFVAENGRWYCKFCKYVFYCIYLRSVSLSNA